MLEYKLTDWYLVDATNHYVGNYSKVFPNMEYRRGVYLVGKLPDDHPNRPGKVVQTSAIQQVNFRKVYTRNTVYILGNIHPSFRKYLNDNNIPYDKQSPVKSYEYYCNN